MKGPQWKDLAEQFEARMAFGLTPSHYLAFLLDPRLATLEALTLLMNRATRKLLP